MEYNNGNDHSNGYHCHRCLNGRDGSKIMAKGIDNTMQHVHIIRYDIEDT